MDVDLLGVLGGDDHGVDPLGVALVVILHGNLALAVGPQPGKGSVLAELAQGAGQIMGVADRGGHKLLRFVAGKAEHHALIACAGGFVVIGRVYAHGDILGLLVYGGQHGAGVSVEASLRGVVADVQQGAASDLGDIHVAVAGDLAGHQDHAGSSQGFTGHAGHGVLRQKGVQNAVRDLVADLVGMSLGDGFRGKDSFHHSRISFRVAFTVYRKKALCRAEWWGCFLICRFSRRNWHLASLQVAGLHRAGPSTTLDKAL